jgi:hypothetical protein
MYGFVLQDWITVRGGSIADIIQGESTWMGFSSFQDIVIWLDVREMTTPGTSLTWFYETSPSKDNNLFSTMASTVVSTLTPGVQTIQKVILSSASVPLATWVRWRLSPSGATTPWDATFRILVAANRVIRDRNGRSAFA